MIVKTYIDQKVVDITQLVSVISWSGSSEEVARTLQLTLLYATHDSLTPKMYPKIGQFFYLYTDNGQEVFRGRCYTTEKSNEQGTIQITCYDEAIRLSKSKGTFNFKNMPAEKITSIAANEIGIKCNKLAATKINQKMLCEGKGLYEIIVEAYTGASKQNGKSYKVIMMEGKLNVVEVGATTLNYVLSDKQNILEFTYSEDASNVINRVKIYSEKATYLDMVKNDTSINLLGVIQDIYQKEEDKQARTVASSMLTSIEKTVSVKVLGHVSLISGYAVKIFDTTANIEGKFVIKNDSHEWSNGQYFTSLDLVYKGGAMVG